jgi:HSP20 family protein
VALPAQVDSSKAVAKFENGVLEVSLPKKQESKPKKVEVN